jgi:hypothetical protein
VAPRNSLDLVGSDNRETDPATVAPMNCAGGGIAQSDANDEGITFGRVTHLAPPKKSVPSARSDARMKGRPFAGITVKDRPKTCPLAS